MKLRVHIVAISGLKAQSARRKAQGARRKARGARREAQGAKRKAPGARSKAPCGYRFALTSWRLPLGAYGFALGGFGGVIEVGAEPAFDFGQGEAFAELVVADLVAIEFADGKVARVRMSEIKA